MAKQCMIQREKRRAKLSRRYKPARDALRAIKNDPNASFEEKVAADEKLQKLPRDSMPCRRRNRCVKTGRPRGYYRKFGLSRNMLREHAMFGDIPGLHKASW